VQEDNLQHLALFTEYGRVALRADGVDGVDGVDVDDYGYPRPRPFVSVLAV
jgi:hypothetical protein